MSILSKNAGGNTKTNNVITLPQTIKPLSVRVDALPIALTERDQWLLWKYVHRGGAGVGDKPTKVPFQTTGMHASSTKPDTWCSFSEAVSVYKRGGYSGIGFALNAGDGLAAIDLDGCITAPVDEQGYAKIDEIAFNDTEQGYIAEEIFYKFVGKAYIEISPSGKGLRMFVKGAAQRSGKGDAKAGLNFIEVYDHNSPRYLTITGNANYVSDSGAGAVEPQDAQKELDWLHDKYMSRNVAETGTEGVSGAEERLSIVLPEMPDEEVLNLLRNSAQQKDKFARLFDGEGLSRSDYGNEPEDEDAYGESVGPTLWDTRTDEQLDWSSEDMKLLELLAWATNRNEPQMLRIFQRAYVYRDEKMETLRGGIPFGLYNVRRAIDLHKEARRSTYGEWLMKDATCALFGGAEAASGEVDPNFAWVLEFNERYSPVLYGGKMAVAFEQFDAGLGQHSWQFVTFYTFKEMHCADEAVIGYKGAKPILGAKGAGWLEHNLRVKPRKLIFDPAKPPKLTEEGYLNLWDGLNVTGDPSKGDAMPMVEHIQKIIAGGDKELSTYIMGWIALLIQQPGYRHEVALVLRGEQGCGKGTLANLLCRIFGRHSQAITQGSQLTGKFNQHLQDCCFLFADEAFFAGRKEDEGALKGIITEPKITIEPKGHGVFQAPNRLSVLMATNSDFAVPATADARRYEVVDVLSDRVGDREYWKNLHSWQRSPDNIAAFVEFMRAIDISDYDPREFIETHALAEQRAHSLEAWAKWWQEALMEGVFIGPARWQWAEYAKVASLHELFLDYCNRHRIDKYERLPLVVFGKKLKAHKLVSVTDVHRIHDAKELLGAGSWREDLIGESVRCRRIGTLDEARKAFIKEFKVPADTFD